MEPLNFVTIVFGGVIGPALTEVSKRLSARWQWLQDAEIWAAVNLVITLAAYLLGWIAADGTRAHLGEWMMAALAAAGLGGAGANLWRKKVSPGASTAPPAS